MRRSILLCDLCNKEVDRLWKWEIKVEGINRDGKKELCDECNDKLLECLSGKWYLKKPEPAGEYHYDGIPDAIHAASFHGEIWYHCPSCGRSFEYHKAKFGHDGIKKTDNEHVYICSCGLKFRL